MSDGSNLTCTTNLYKNIIKVYKNTVFPFQESQNDFHGQPKIFVVA